MSQDKIGAIVRAAVGINHAYHGILLDVVNRLNSDNAAAWQARYAEAHEQGLPKKEPPKPVVYLKRLYENEQIVLSATDGSQVISPENDLAKSVFTAGIDHNFKNWRLDGVSRPTLATTAVVYEQVSDGAFAQIYASVGRPLEQLKWTPHQVVMFSTMHCNRLRGGGYGNFFLLQRGLDFFVANVDVHTGGHLSVHVRQFSYGGVWFAKYRHRFVLPQLAPLAA